ncbi:MAG: 1,4-dihydroxy-2-naphthoyl-CoA synthase [Thermoflavifilum sp.]|nr:1,4-dihydroxy-2-naphthoyl-CoA synthase [Thermoflavifilum sp.]MCL6514055.1 1,4-dihydroxy-2-naphthoyl-CoA synthase [Alicyclobacillus sp.]
MAYQDILYTKEDGIATITINRPEVLNAFRPLTVEEMIHAFQDAWADRQIGVVVLTGAGDKAFCVGGDQKARLSTGAAGGYGGRSRSEIGLDVEDLHAVIRGIPKPVIAAVNGYAIGGGHVLHVLCDLSIASDRAVFGQVGPKVGSVDPGFGTAYLARVVGEKKAREMWYLCRRYTAEEAERMGLVNKVVPHDELYAEVRRWCEEILDKSPTALKLAKYSFNADSDNIEGISRLGMSALALYYGTEEAQEGNQAFVEKRPVNFRRFRRWTG